MCAVFHKVADVCYKQLYMNCSMHGRLASDNIA